jgi:hypothetical protein
VRAIQEEEMLKTKIMKRSKESFYLSFHEAWNANADLRRSIHNSLNTIESKWIFQHDFDYRLATNFMPMYASYIFKYFHGGNVLDPCAGWGDRLAGALASGCVKSYVGFDPNLNLYAGYKKILADYEVQPTVSTEDADEYSNGYKLYRKRFEHARKYLATHPPFDFALTGPPFFDYEHYGEHMPQYENWIENFYIPLFMITHDHLKPGSYFAIYLSDTTAGKIQNFMRNTVPQITTFRFMGKIGLTGCSSGRLRDIHVYQRS